MSPLTQIITALDVDTHEQALAAAQSLGPEGAWVKVGFQLFTRCGPAIVEDLRDLGKRVFLDLKFHDIPNTVAKGAAAAADLGASFITVHASGGKAMIAAAREAVEGTDTRILAVTVLTSLSDEALRDEVGFPETSSQAVVRLAQLAVYAGTHGIVCSPREIELVRHAVGDEPLVVTPGVRPAWASRDDQARVMTPKEAARAGANFLVIGRPVLRHENPALALRLVREEMA
jgi:orotidine-5'-phosphate decarboxylase